MEEARSQPKAAGSRGNQKPAAPKAGSPTETANEERLTRPERFEILKVEMTLLQSRFDKFDSLVFQMRGWLITIVVGLLGAALSLKKGQLTVLAAGVAVLFYFLETLWRQNWFKYVIRYRRIRDTVFYGESIENLAPYDLTAHFGDRLG